MLKEEVKTLTISYSANELNVPEKHLKYVTLYLKTLELLLTLSLKHDRNISFDFPFIFLNCLHKFTRQDLLALHFY